MPVTYASKALSPEWSYKLDPLKTTARTVHQVTASEPTTLAAAVTWFIANVMAIGGNYPGTTGSVLPCVGVDPKFVDQTRMLLRFESEFDSTITAFASPLDAPVEIEVDGESFDEAYFIDKTPTTPLQARHTNGVPFSTLPTRQASIRTIKLTKNVAGTKTMADYDALQDTVNNGSVAIDGVTYTARTLLINKIGLSKVQTVNGVAYRVLSATLKAKKSTWDQKFESIGVEELVGGVLKPITEGTQPVSEPWPLQSTGAKAASRATTGYEIVLRPYDTSASLADLL